MPSERQRPRRRTAPAGGPIVDPPFFARRFPWSNPRAGYPDDWDLKRADEIDWRTPGRLLLVIVLFMVVGLPALMLIAYLAAQIGAH